MAWVGGGFMSHKTMVQNATFISSSCDEVTTINNQSWIFVRVYVMKSF
jgi:hypothetical protein